MSGERGNRREDLSMPIPADEMIMISALQHYVYCPRQFYIGHVEQYWKDNCFTADGKRLHERVDLPGNHRESGRRVEYALPLSSRTYGITGVADAVEFTADSVMPVEYKRGREKPDNRDAVQLCAQVFCLEEMLKCSISRAVLRRYLRDHDSEDTAVCSAADRLKELIELLRSADSVDRMRGLEGKGADIYFSVFDRLRTRREDAFRFDGRSRRPPLDRMNALLSFAYTLPLHEVIGALESVGLDPAAGFLHCDRPGRASLVLDLLEEYRAPVADRFVLSLVNNRRIAEHDFQVRSNGAVLLTDAGRKTFLSFWQQRKKDELEHGFIGEKISLGLLFFIQARIMAKYLRGEIDSYVPYIWK